MTDTILIVIAAGILLYGLISKRLERSIITAPMIFVLFGFLIGPSGAHLASFNLGHGFIHIMAELTLILILFTDATRIDLRCLRREHNLPVRMLSIGLPFIIIFGTITAVLLLGFNLWEAAILAVIVAPTDAALGLAVINSKKVPVRIRQTLNVESGLNDGLVLPILLIFISLAQITVASGSVSYWILFIALQIIIGPLIGFIVGFVGGKLITYASKTGWMNHVFQDLGALGLSILAYALAELLHGNGFLAAFCCGLAVGNFSRSICQCLYDFAEAEGQLLALLIFMIFGAVMLPNAIEHFSGTMLLYAILSLTLIRLAAITLSLIGLKLCWESILFLGWFGPRGIASILFGLLLLEKSHIPGSQSIIDIVTLTVTLSVFIHGISAYPAARWYGKRLAKNKSKAELIPVSEMPKRISASID